MMSKENKKVRVLAIFKAPAPYIDPLLQLWAIHPKVDLVVAYCVKTTDGETYYDPVTGKKVAWGKKLLGGGYKYLFLEDSMEAIGKSDFKISNRRIKKYIRDHQFDVILMGSSYCSPTTWMAIQEAKKKHIPMITRMTVEAGRKRNAGVLLMKKLLVSRYCKNMAAGVYECRQQKEYMEHYGMRKESLFSAPCAVDNGYFSTQCKKYHKSALRSELGIPREAVVFVATGALIPRKRQKDVIQALKILKEKGIEPYYYMVGDGADRNEIELLAKKNGLKHVYVTGQLPQNEMSKYLRLSDVYILSSENDASPKALNEAMNFSLPIIITTGVGTAEELLRDGKNGYIYPPGDVNALAIIMEQIMERTDRTRMGEIGREIVERYDYNRMIEGWMNAVQYAMEHTKGEKA